MFYLLQVLQVRRKRSCVVGTLIGVGECGRIGDESLERGEGEEWVMLVDQGEYEAVVGADVGAGVGSVFRAEPTAFWCMRDASSAASNKAV